MKWTATRGLAAALVVLLGIWAGISVRSHRTPQSESAVFAPAGHAGPPSSESSTDADEVPPAAQIPARLPQFSLRDLAGKSTPVSQWRGHALVLNFWATWCGPCRREIPLLSSLATQWRPSGVMFVGIAVDHPEQVKQFAQQFKITYPLLVGEQDALDVAAELGMKSAVFPFTVFADRKGEVVALFIGELHPPQAELILATVRDVDQNRLPIERARQQIAAGLHTAASKTL